MKCNRLIDLTLIGIGDCGDIKTDQFILPKPRGRGQKQQEK